MSDEEYYLASIEDIDGQNSCRLGRITSPIANLARVSLREEIK